MTPIMSTIRGERIRLVRPERYKKPIVRKGDYPKAKYDEKPKTREIGVAEFFKLCLEFKDRVPRPKYWKR